MGSYDWKRAFILKRWLEHKRNKMFSIETEFFYSNQVDVSLELNLEKSKKVSRIMWVMQAEMSNWPNSWIAFMNVNSLNVNANGNGHSVGILGLNANVNVNWKFQKRPIHHTNSVKNFQKHHLFLVYFIFKTILLKNFYFNYYFPIKQYQF